jgi:hypothetical protein
MEYKKSHTIQQQRAEIIPNLQNRARVSTKWQDGKYGMKEDVGIGMLTESAW